MQLVLQKEHAEGEDDAVVREVVAALEARYERLVEDRLTSEHQNEWEEHWVSSTGDGHARGEKPGSVQKRQKDSGPRWRPHSAPET